jgi:hypothetical protein
MRFSGFIHLIFNLQTNTFLCIDINECWIMQSLVVSLSRLKLIQANPHVKTHHLIQEAWLTLQNKLLYWCSYVRVYACNFFDSLLMQQTLLMPPIDHRVVAILSFCFRSNWYLRRVLCGWNCVINKEVEGIWTDEVCQYTKCLYLWVSN